jgi:hypothetical protein
MAVHSIYAANRHIERLDERLKMKTGKRKTQKEGRRHVIRASKLPTDCNIYVKELEETLMNCFNQWREMTAATYRYLGTEQSLRVKGLDCIEWFCASMKARLEELRRQQRYPELSESVV